MVGGYYWKNNISKTEFNRKSWGRLFDIVVLKELCGEVTFNWRHEGWEEVNLKIVRRNISGRLTYREKKQWHQKRLER